MHSYTYSAKNTFLFPSTGVAKLPSSSYKVLLQLNPLNINKMKVSVQYKSHNGKVSEAATDPSADGLALSPKNNDTSNDFPFLINLATFWSTFSANLINPPLPPSVDPKVVLQGNFAPVDEMPPTECLVVTGKLPPSLTGAYIRNGPNPQHERVGPHDFLEGDGMLHSVRLSEGRAVFCSRYVKTYRYNLEKNAGVPLIPNIFSGFYGLVDIFRVMKALGKVILGQISLMKGVGLANSCVIFFANKIFALVEFDLPYAIGLSQDGDIETIGQYDFDGELSTNMTCHPKIDREIGEMFAFRCLPFYPYLTFFRDARGLKLQKDVPIYSMSRPAYVHDLGITKRYAIFPDVQVKMDLFNLISCMGMPLTYDANKVSRIGVLPRYDTSESQMKWFEVPGFNPFHIINAWEDEDDDDSDTIVIIAANALFLENFMSNREKVHFSLEKLKIDMKTGMVKSRTTLSERSLEEGSINSSYIGKKNRYAYMAVCEDIVPKMVGVVKIDLELECEVGSRIYGQGWYGGEAFFVAADGGDDEENGYVLSYVHNELSGESQFIVMDAKSPSLDIVAAVKLPGRVPYGIHGLFVSEKDLGML